MAKRIGHLHRERLQRPVRVSRRQPVHRLAWRKSGLGQRLSVSIKQRPGEHLGNQECQLIAVRIEGVRRLQQCGVAHRENFILMSAGQIVHDRDLRRVLHRLNRDAHFRRGRLKFPVAHDEREAVLPVEILARHVAQVSTGTGELAVLRQVNHPERQCRVLNIRPIKLNLYLPVLLGHHRRIQRHRRRVDFLDFNHHFADGFQFTVRNHHVETEHTRPLLLSRCPLDGLRGLREAHAVGRSPQRIAQHAVGAAIVVGRYHDLQRFALEHLQRLDALDVRWRRVHHDHLPHRRLACVAPAVLCLVADFIRTDHTGNHLAADLHRCRQVSLHAIRCRRPLIFVRASRLELHRRLAVECDHRAFCVHDFDGAHFHLGFVPGAVLHQIFDRVIAGDFRVHRAVRDQPGSQIAVQVIRCVHSGIGELIPGLRLHRCVAN